MGKFSTKTHKRTPVDELRDAFNYLMTINPEEAKELLEKFRCTVGAEEGDYSCPSQLCGESTQSFTNRVEVLIRATEANNRDKIAHMAPVSN